MARSKKEIDKELMYKKLMPTAQLETDNSAAQPESAPAPAPSPSAPPAPAAESAEPSAAFKPAPPAPAQPAVPSPAAAIISGSAPQPEGEIVNMMELLVDARIDAAMDKFHCCTCDKCRRDVTAITLNKLVPCYILSNDTAKRTEIEATHAGQVATAIVQAILTVKARPAHN